MEHHAERQMSYAEKNIDEGAHAVEHIFEAAQDHLEDREQRQRDTSSEEREHAMDEAVDTLRRQMRRQQTAQVVETSPASSAINLLATKGKGDAADPEATLSHWQQTVNSDKKTLSAAITNMEGAAKEYRRASKNHTHAATLSLNLAEETFQQDHSDASTARQHAMSDFNDALSNLKSTSPTGNWQEAEKVVREKSAKVQQVLSKRDMMLIRG